MNRRQFERYEATLPAFNTASVLLTQKPALTKAGAHLDERGHARFAQAVVRTLIEALG